MVTSVARSVFEAFGRRLEALLEERGLTKSDLARHLKVEPSTVSRYAKGRVPDASTLDEIARFFSVTTDYILGRSNQRTPNLTPTARAVPDNSREEKPFGHRPMSLPIFRATKGVDDVSTVTWESLPVIGRIVAGLPLLSEQHITARIEVPAHIARRCKFALEVHGDSMIGAGIQPGDIVFMAEANSGNAAHGNIVAAMVGGEMTLKRLIKVSTSPKRYALRAENSAYPDIPMNEDVDIQGVYVARYTEHEGLVEPPADDLTGDELITRLAKQRGLDPDVVSGILDALGKGKK